MPRNRLREEDLPDRTRSVVAAARLESIGWFSRCGSPPVLIEAAVVNSREDAHKRLASVEWENFKLERRGDLTVFITTQRPDARGLWNAATRHLKDALATHFDRVESTLQVEELPSEWLDDVRWDLLGYFQELVFDSAGAPHFYDRLYRAYAAGSLPCGWVGAYPDGCLVVW